MGYVEKELIIAKKHSKNLLHAVCALWRLCVYTSTYVPDESDKEKLKFLGQNVGIFH